MQAAAEEDFDNSSLEVYLDDGTSSNSEPNKRRTTGKGVCRTQFRIHNERCNDVVITDNELSIIGYRLGIENPADLNLDNILHKIQSLKESNKQLSNQRLNLKLEPSNISNELAKKMLISALALLLLDKVILFAIYYGASYQPNFIQQILTCISQPQCKALIFTTIATNIAIKTGEYTTSKLGLFTEGTSSSSSSLTENQDQDTPTKTCVPFY